MTNSASPHVTARKLNLGELTILGPDWIARDAESGKIYKFAKNRWIELVPVATAARHVQRILRYAGHPLGRSKQTITVSA